MGKKIDKFIAVQQETNALLAKSLLHNNGGLSRREVDNLDGEDYIKASEQLENLHGTVCSDEIFEVKKEIVHLKEKVERISRQYAKLNAKARRQTEDNKELRRVAKTYLKSNEKLVRRIQKLERIFEMMVSLSGKYPPGLDIDDLYKMLKRSLTSQSYWDLPDNFIHVKKG